MRRFWRGVGDIFVLIARICADWLTGRVATLTDIFDTGRSGDKGQIACEWLDAGREKKRENLATQPNYINFITGKRQKEAVSCVVET